MKGNNFIKLILIVLVILFGIYVWPTPYRNMPPTSYISSNHRPFRIHRITGRGELWSPSLGWKVIGYVPPKVIVSEPEKPKYDWESLKAKFEPETTPKEEIVPPPTLTLKEKLLIIQLRQTKEGTLPDWERIKTMYESKDTILTTEELFGKKDTIVK
jgi:hypothetical protein